MKPVIPEFILNPNEDEKANSHPDRKPHDVDDRMECVFSDISKGNYEIIFKHRHPPVKRCIHKSRKRFDDLPPNPDSHLETALCASPIGVHVCEIAVQIDIILLGEDMPQQP
jgi:hypothetical protein